MGKFELQLRLNLPKERGHVARHSLGSSVISDEMSKSLRVKLLLVGRVHGRQNKSNCRHAIHYRGISTRASSRLGLASTMSTRCSCAIMRLQALLCQGANIKC